MVIPELTGIILSGGKGERLDGRDKGLCDYQSKPLIQHCIDSLKPQVGTILISCNRNLNDYSVYGLKLVTDERVNYQGPLAGLEAGMRQCNTEYIVTWPVDTQPVPVNLVRQLHQALLDHKVDIAYLNQAHKAQYLIAVMRSNLQPSLTDYLNSRQRKVRDWYAMHKTVACSAFLDVEIKNLNTPESF